MQVITIPDDWMKVAQDGIQAFNEFRFNDAFNAFARFLAQWPRHAATWSNLGNVYFATGQHAGALAAYEQAVRLDPKFWHFSYNLGIELCLRGRLKRGLGLEMARFADTGNPQYNRFRDKPMWRGQQVGTLCIYHDQGFGDQLAMSRFIETASRRARKTILELGHSDFVDLYRRLIPPSVEIVIDEIPDAQAYIPMLGLPLALKAWRLTRWPAPSLALLSDEINAARVRLHAEAEGRPTVFFNWKGGELYPYAKLRSPGLKAFRGWIHSRTDLFWFNCNPDGIADVADTGLPITTFKGSWLETAAFLKAADYAISTCTSSAHLMGALGRPGAVLLMQTPYWMWGLHGSRSSLYPTLTLIRQPAFNGWDPVIQQAEKYIL